MKCKECQNKIKCEECGKVIDSPASLTGPTCYCGCHNLDGSGGVYTGSCIHCRGYEITGGAGGTTYP